MRLFVNKAFKRFMRHEGIGSADLFQAVRRIGAGQADADLGGGVFKQRIARRGGGKSGGYRVIVMVKLQSRAVFVFGYAKSERANIGPLDLAAFRALATILLDASESDLAAALDNRTLFELDAEEEYGNEKAS